MNSPLALLGGPRAITKPFVRYNSIGDEEVTAAMGVVKSGVLSKFLGGWNPDFFGGPQVQAFEREWAQHFNVTHAVTVNSNTSGLIAALGAVGIEPGDEVIVSPWTMTASATSILVWNAIPVFADIEPRTFNLDPASITANITPRTRAIMVTDIFGHAAALDEIMAVARRHGLAVIEDAAQAPGARYHNAYVGTVADIGVFSLNYHKHIHTGEGGICVTNRSDLAKRLQLIRNHGEAVVAEAGVTDITNIIGFNFRMTEIEAAIGREQLKKLPHLVKARRDVADRLTMQLQNLVGLTLPYVAPDCSHVYYVYPLQIDPTKLGLPRSVLHAALQADGVPVASGYCNIHLLPIYQQRIAYGRHGFPWTADFYKGNVSYDKGICPVAEMLHDETYLGIHTCEYLFSTTEIDAIGAAFRKVWQHLPALRSWHEQHNILQDERVATR